jgi:hypothetical protein
MTAMPLPFDSVVDNSGWGKFPALNMNNVTFVVPSDGTYTITAGLSFGGPPYVRVNQGTFFLVLNGKDGTPNRKAIIPAAWADITKENIGENENRLFKPTYRNRDNDPEVSLSSAKTLGAAAAVRRSPFDIVTSASTSYRFAKGDTFGVAFGCDRPSSDDPSLEDLVGDLRGNKAGTLTYVSIQKTGL